MCCHVFVHTDSLVLNITTPLDDSEAISKAVLRDVCPKAKQVSVCSVTIEVHATHAFVLVHALAFQHKPTKDR